MEELQNQINNIRQELESLKLTFYKGNFSGRQDFTKYSDFKTMIKVPNYSATPSTCKVGELIEVSGKLYICSATDTWTVCGTQA